MNAVAKGERSTVIACHIEPVGIAELLRIAVSCSEEEYKLLTTSNPMATQLVVLQHHARGELHRAVVTEQLLNRAGDPLGIATEELQLLGIAQQRDYPVCDQVGRSLVSRDEEQNTGRE